MKFILVGIENKQTGHITTWQVPSRSNSLEDIRIAVEEDARKRGHDPKIVQSLNDTFGLRGGNPL